MTAESSRIALRVAFCLGGAVAIVAGLHSVLAGAKSLPGQGRADPVIESELRFYAAFYIAYGVTAVRVAPRVDSDPTAVRALLGALFLAGLARAFGWSMVGRPHRVQRGLLVIELVLPPVIAAWQARVAPRLPAPRQDHASTSAS